MLDLIVVTNHYQYTRKWLGDQGLHMSFRTEELKVSVFSEANLHRLRGITFSPGDRLFANLNMRNRTYPAFIAQIKEFTSSAQWPEAAVHYHYVE